MYKGDIKRRVGGYRRGMVTQEEILNALKSGPKDTNALASILKVHPRQLSKPLVALKRYGLIDRLTEEVSKRWIYSLRGLAKCEEAK